MPLINGNSASLNVYSSLPLILSQSKSYALATVTVTQGSAPQKTGSAGLFGEEGLVAGTIGGGVVEYSIQNIAKEAIKNKISAFHSFDLTKDISDSEGGICGGKMEILLDTKPEKHIAVFKNIKKSLFQRTPGVMVTYIITNKKGYNKIERQWVTSKDLEYDSTELAPELRGLVGDMLAQPAEGDFKKADFDQHSGKRKLSICLEKILPPPRLIIAGAGHIGKALSHLGKMVGFEVMVWDYRSDYATRENLPDADLILNGSIDNSLAEIKIDKNTYITAVTTGHKNDAEVLKTFLNSNAAYIGMVGSKKKGILMREKFINEGWATAEQWEQIHTPIGLDINSETVEEIAVSIAAQLIQVRHKSDRKL